ncbi:hypothetical protein [Thiocystis violacea]|uniref:hypothetical protein n=1 Tax=Thiocystis violacea TaxID=13725 RepID=UPI001904AF5B|nr:hypothetical protein [Thiocystis violacea]
MRRLYSIQPQRSSLAALSTLLVPGAVLGFDDRPATLAAAGGNPLALNAMAFLGWYWTVLLVLVAVAAAVRCACLAGGSARRPDHRRNAPTTPI